MRERLWRHWPEYVMEAAGLGLFMIVAAACASILEHPASPVRQVLVDPLLRRALMGVAMGATSIALVYSPIGARSGAHLNPATTLTFYRLGRVHGIDAAAYVAAQCAGALAGIAVAALLLSPWIAAPGVHYVATVPGPWGRGAALAAEFAIAFVLMTVVLHVSNHPRWSRYTGLCAGALVCVYIALEAPVSGMSLNPARSLGPAMLTREFDTLWIYAAGPLTGMLLAAEAFVRGRGSDAVRCAKLHHHSAARCIFHCRFGAHPS
jgi:aquaporin Z